MTRKTLHDADGDALKIESFSTGVMVRVTMDGSTASVGPLNPDKIRKALDEVAPRPPHGPISETMQKLLDEQAERKELGALAESIRDGGGACSVGTVRIMRQADWDAAMERHDRFRDELDETKHNLHVALGEVARLEARLEVTDDMVERAARAAHGYPRFTGVPWHEATSNRRANLTKEVTRALRAALTPEPPRPEGAEDIEAFLADLPYLADETGASLVDIGTLANDLAARARQEADG